MGSAQRPDGFEGEWWRDGDAQFEAALQRLTAANASLGGRRPAAIAQPACEEDVQRVVHAAKAGLRDGALGAVPLCIRGGGHSEMCLFDGAIAIDFHCARDFTEVHCDPETRLVTVGAGSTLLQVKEAAAAHGLGVPMGLYDGVGIGLLLQGGVGHLARLHGMAVDNITSMQVVTASGELRWFTEDDVEEDAASFFWALRGAAPNFGVVTRLTVRAYPVGPDALHGRIQRYVNSVNEATDYLLQVQTVLRGVGRDQHIDFALGHIPSAPEGSGVIALFPFSVHGRPFDCVDLESLGASSEQLITTSYAQLPYPELDNEMAGESGDPSASESAGAQECTQASADVQTYVRQCFVDELSRDGLALLAEALFAMPSRMSQIVVQHAGGKVRDRAPSEIAFASREWELSIVIIAIWAAPEPEVRHASEEWADKLFEAMTPWATGLYPVDINPYRRPDTAAAEARMAFGENMPRLESLKRRHDPENLLRGTFPLRSESGPVD